MVAPVALLPHRLAYWTWTLLQVGLLTWSLVLARRTATAWAPSERRLLVVTIAAFPPLLITYILGTLSLLLLCLWHIMLALATGRQASAGAWLGIAMVKPHLWPLLVVMLLASRQWRSLVTLVIVGVAASTATTLMLGWSVWSAWLSLTVPLLDQRSDITAMYTLRGTLIGLLGDTAMVAVSRFNWLALVAAVLAVAGLWWQRPPATERTFAARFGLTVALGLFLSPCLYPHDSLLMVVPATLGYSIARGWPHVQPVYAGLALASPILLVLSDNLLSPVIGGTLPTLLSLCLIGFLVWSLWRDSRVLGQSIGRHSAVTSDAAGR